MRNSHFVETLLDCSRNIHQCVQRGWVRVSSASNIISKALLKLVKGKKKENFPTVTNVFIFKSVYLDNVFTSENTLEPYLILWSNRTPLETGEKNLNYFPCKKSNVNLTMM